MKIQQMESSRRVIRGGDPAKPATKSRLKRLFERQFAGVVKVSAVEMEKEDSGSDGGGCVETGPSSLCLDKMVRNFMEETNEKPARCGRRRCNCFNGNCSESSDDELDCPLYDDATELKGLVLCGSFLERNLLVEVARIVERNRACRGKEDCRRIVADGLRSLGYDAAICTSRWEKTPTISAGNYEYIDVFVGGDRRRLLVDVDFRSEFEIARSTKPYRAALQSLPSVFVGDAGRLRRIVAVVSEAARVSLVKNGLHVPPWRTAEYMTSKWLAPSLRSSAAAADPDDKTEEPPIASIHHAAVSTSVEAERSTWNPPAVKPKMGPPRRRSKMVAGLASVLREGE